MKTAITTLLTAIALTLTLSASQENLSPHETAQKATVSIDLHDVPTTQALQEISKNSGVTIHAEAVGCGGTKVNLSMHHMPVSDAVSYIAAAANLKVIWKEDGAYVAQQ